MENEIKLTPTEILNRKFTKDVKGYNPTEVDEFLDCVMADYMAFQVYVDSAKQYLAAAREKISELEGKLSKAEEESSKMLEQLRTVEAENASWRSKLGSIKPSDHVNEENMEMLNKINIYEEKFISMGIRPKDVIKEAGKKY